MNGVANCCGFNEYIGEEALKEHDEGLALMFIDLDDFKQPNDVYGHPMGDAVLRAMAEALCTAIAAIRSPCGMETVCDMRTIDTGCLVILTDISRYKARKGDKRQVVWSGHTPPIA